MNTRRVASIGSALVVLACRYAPQDGYRLRAVEEPATEA